MTLPRFTTGKIGRLAFSDMNAAFDSIESDKTGDRIGRTRERRQILAQITAINPDGRMAWVQVRRGDANAFEIVPGGLSSIANGNQYAVPAIALASSPTATDYVMLEPQRDRTGSLYMLVVSGSGSDTRLFRITEIIAHSTRLDMWGYKGKLSRYAWNPVIGGVYEDIPGSQEYSLSNTLEFNPDGANVIGVGTVVPPNVQRIRQAIRIGTVVTATKPAGSGVYSFSVPNGYAIQCPQ